MASPHSPLWGPAAYSATSGSARAVTLWTPVSVRSGSTGPAVRRETRGCLPLPRSSESSAGRGDSDECGALLVRCAHRDPVAFASLYDAVASRAFGLSVRVLRDRNLAEDATQEAFIDIWLNASRFDPTKSSGRTWILTIVHRRAIDRVRSVEASARRDERYFEPTRSGDCDSTSDGAQQRIDAEVVRSALLLLTPSQRGAIELAYFGGLTHTEVASALNVPLGTAKSQIRVGLNRLRAEWAGLPA